MSSLNVKDALSYLDLVKVQFSEHPDVYNRFLDIMKDFKSQAIDTPGVIERVSSLFQGHASLIQGFNTFLPPGYRIGCSHDTSLITVTTPTGTSTVQGARGMAGALAGVTAPAAAPLPAAAAAAAPRAPPLSPPVSHPPPRAAPHPAAVAHESSVALHPRAAQRPYTTTAYSTTQPPLPGASYPNGPTHLATGPVPSQVPPHPPSPAPAAQEPAQGPLEFNRAINYVNKIKQRFNAAPGTYKQFLEILQAYQRGSRPIQKVYAEVTVLFGNDKDLLDEFRQFLPDNSVAPASGGGAGLFGAMHGPPPPLTDPFQQQSAPYAHEVETAGDRPRSPKSQSKKRNIPADAGHAPELAPETEPASKRPKSGKHHTRAEVAPPSPEAYSQEVVVSEEPVYGPSTDAAWYPAEAVFGIRMDAPTEPKEKTLASLGEVALFDRIKRHIDSKAGYTEFLKLLQLFSMDVIDTHLLLDQAALFIGDNPEIFGLFCQMVGFDQGKDDWLTTVPPVLANIPAQKRDLVNPPLYKAYGPSYRRLPRYESNLSCSGRDALCWSVLNDSFLSVPLLSSETEGFVHHETNPYERALFRSEEERHEFDHHIELNLRTIELLMSLVARIEKMPEAHREALRLPPDLGAASPTIHERVIKKVYGRETGLEILAAMADSPAVTLPIVLARLKEKDKAWRTRQRDWNQIWRQVDGRNFYKSLDHQGANFKANDKRATTSKAFVTEIESERARQLAQHETVFKRIRAESVRQGQQMDPPRPWPCYQHAVKMEDKDVFGDVIKMCVSHLDRTTSYSKPDMERIESFVRSLGPLFFALDPADVEAWVTPLRVEDGDGKDKDGPSALVDVADGDDPAPAQPGQGQGLVHNVEGARSPSPTEGSTTLDTWMQFGGLSDRSPNADVNLPKDIDSLSIYADQQIFVFVKLFETIYTRLMALKKAAAQRADVYPSKQRMNPVAVALGLQDPNTGPGAVVGALACAANENPEDQGGLYLHPRHYYRTLLEMCERLFEGEIDQSSFEEAARFMFDIHAYPIFTVDKLINSLIKAIHTLVTDQRSLALIEQAQLSRDRTRKAAKALRSNPQNERVKVDWYRCHIDQRMSSEGIVTPDEHLFRIVWNPSEVLLTCQLLGRDELTLPQETTSKHSKLLYYLATYASWYPSEGLPRAATARFLPRNLALAGRTTARRPTEESRGESGATSAQEQDVSFSSQHGLQGFIDPYSFRLSFVQGQDDLMFRHRRRKLQDGDKEIATRRARKEARLTALLDERIALYARSDAPPDHAPDQCTEQSHAPLDIDSAA